MESYLVLRYKSAASWNDVPLHTWYLSPTDHCRLSLADTLWQHQLFWHSELSTNTAARKCQEGFMACSSDSVTPRWKSRCFGNKTSQCGKRKMLTLRIKPNIFCYFPRTSSIKWLLIAREKISNCKEVVTGVTERGLSEEPKIIDCRCRSANHWQVVSF